MEAFVLIVLAILFVVICVMLFFSIIRALIDEDPLYYIGASIFILLLIGVTLISYEFNNYIGGIF